jgi:hypothetical protein
VEFSPKASLGEKTSFIPCYSLSTILIRNSHSILRFGGTGTLSLGYFTENSIIKQFLSI